MQSITSKKELIEHLIFIKALKSENIVNAFKKIDRGDFIPEESRDDAYEDMPLSIGMGQTISQPYTVAFMLELLAPQKGEKILDIGAGSGWTVALLAEIVGPEGKVIATERIKELAEFGKNNLSKYSFSNAEIRWVGDRELGIPLGAPEDSPFDKILVSATSHEAPKELVDQLKAGGRLVMPVGNAIWQLDKASNKEIKKTEHPGFVFVPLVR